jgi:DNA-nicking Smr family endonuclease
MIKRKKPAVVSAEDASLFRESIGDVRRIEADEVAAVRPPPAPVPRMRARDEAEALRESRLPALEDAAFDGSEPLSYRRDEISARTLKRLAAGQYSAQDEIDLHHLRSADAEIMLKRFLDQARAEDRFCVRIIHGKGRRSESTPVLKALVARLLRLRGDVLAFASAPSNQGGTGAVLILLNRR